MILQVSFRLKQSVDHIHSREAIASNFSDEKETLLIVQDITG